MATYPPPTEDLLTFNPLAFDEDKTPLTIEGGAKYFVKFPIETRTETLTDAIITGVLSTTLATDNLVYGFQSYNGDAGSSGNTAFGNHTLKTAGVRTKNTAFGELALNNLTTGSNNTAVGHSALDSITSGSFNTAVGVAVAPFSSVSNSNTTLGYNAKVDSGFSTSTAIGANALATASNEVVLGTASEVVRYNFLRPLYTTLPTFTDQDIGYVKTFTPNGAGTGGWATSGNLVAPYTIPTKGVYLFCMNITYDGFTTTNQCDYIDCNLPELTTTALSRVYAKASTSSLYNWAVSKICPVNSTSITMTITCETNTNTGGTLTSSIQLVRIA